MDGEIDLLDKQGEAHALERYAEENTSQIKEDVRKVGELEIIEGDGTDEGRGSGEEDGAESGRADTSLSLERQAEPAPKDPMKEALKPGRRVKSVDEVLGWGQGKRRESEVKGKEERPSAPLSREEGKEEGEKERKDDENPPDEMPEVREDAEVPGEKPDPQ